MLGRLSLVAAAALVATAVPAAADAVHVEATSPTCGLLANVYTCLTVWAEADPEATLRCVVLADPTTVCATVTCTPSLPPSRCEGAGFAAGMRL